MQPIETSSSLLPQEHKFLDLLWIYTAPYLVYVVSANIPQSILPKEVALWFQLLSTGAIIVYFLKYYRFGRFKPVHVLFVLAAFPVALALWVFPIYLLDMIGIFNIIRDNPYQQLSSMIWGLRLFNSVVLVAIFEELFIRVFVMGFLYQAGVQKREKRLIAALSDTLDQFPYPHATIPISTFSVIGTAIVFAGGHHAHEYLSGVLYFLFTTWLYKITGSLWVCIIIHGLTNFAIWIMAGYYSMDWLWS